MEMVSKERASILLNTKGKRRAGRLLLLRQIQSRRSSQLSEEAPSPTSPMSFHENKLSNSPSESFSSVNSGGETSLQLSSLNVTKLAPLESTQQRMAFGDVVKKKMNVPSMSVPSQLQSLTSSRSLSSTSSLNSPQVKKSSFKQSSRNNDVRKANELLAVIDKWATKEAAQEDTSSRIAHWKLQTSKEMREARRLEAEASKPLKQSS